MGKPHEHLQTADEILAASRGNRDKSRIAAVSLAGKLIVESLFKGELQAWREHAKDRPMHIAGGDRSAAAEAQRAIKVYDLSVRLPLLLSSRLTLSHIVTVLPLGAYEQERLLTDAIAGEWTVRKLRQMLDCTQSRRPPATGRPRTAPVIKTLSYALAPHQAFEGAEDLLALDRDTAQKLLRVCRRARRELKRAELNLRMAASERPKRRVLVVDSTRSFGLRARQQLRAHGCVIRMAASCAEALAALDPLVRCAVIDLFLPDGCGFELGRQLRSTRPSIQCIFVTDIQRTELPPHLKEIEPLVFKASGLVPLRVALAKIFGGGEDLSRPPLARAPAA